MDTADLECRHETVAEAAQTDISIMQVPDVDRTASKIRRLQTKTRRRCSKGGMGRSKSQALKGAGVSERVSTE